MSLVSAYFNLYPSNKHELQRGLLITLTKEEGYTNQFTLEHKIMSEDLI